MLEVVAHPPTGLRGDVEMGAVALPPARAFHLGDDVPLEVEPARLAVAGGGRAQHLGSVGGRRQSRRRIGRQREGGDQANGKWAEARHGALLRVLEGGDS